MDLHAALYLEPHKWNVIGSERNILSLFNFFFLLSRFKSCWTQLDTARSPLAHILMIDRISGCLSRTLRKIDATPRENTRHKFSISLLFSLRVERKSRRNVNDLSWQNCTECEENSFARTTNDKETQTVCTSFPLSLSLSLIFSGGQIIIINSVSIGFRDI